MKSGLRGKHTPAVEVTNVSQHGFWLLIDDTEKFLPFELFPWFLCRLDSLSMSSCRAPITCTGRIGISILRLPRATIPSGFRWSAKSVLIACAVRQKAKLEWAHARSELSSIAYGEDAQERPGYPRAFP